MIVFFFLVWFAVLVSNGFVIEDPKDTALFRVGDLLYQSTNDTRGYMFDVLLDCTGDHSFTRRFYLHYLSAVGLGLSQLSSSTIQTYDNYHASHIANQCAVGKGSFEKEFLFHMALASWPWNSFVAKNLAFVYEWQGRIGATDDLYKKAWQLLYVCY